MFDVGFGELVLLFVIGLLVLGPQRLPKVAAELGKWVGRARRTATQLRRQLEHEIELSEVIQPPKPPPKPKPPTATESQGDEAAAEQQSAAGHADPGLAPHWPVDESADAGAPANPPPPPAAAAPQPHAPDTEPAEEPATAGTAERPPH